MSDAVGKARVLSLVLNDFRNDSRVLKECQSLRAAGYEVEVVALHEEGLPEHELVAGIPVHRIALRSRSWPRRRFVQLFKYAELALRLWGRFRGYDVVHCNDLDTLPIGVVLKLLSDGRTKLVYDAHEYEINTIPNQSAQSIRIHYLVERALIGWCDHVITVSASIAQAYARMYRRDLPSLVLNCPVYDECEKEDWFRSELGIRSDQTIFLYQGGFSRGRGIELLLEVFARLQADDLVIVFMGYGALESEIQDHARRYSTIFYRQAVPPAILLRYTASADFGILFYEDSCLNHVYCSPNKMFEYLMAGIPVLVADLQEMKRLVEEYGVGVVAESNTSEGFQAALQRVLSTDYDALVENVQRARRHFCWEEQEKVLLGVYGGLLVDEAS